MKRNDLIKKVSVLTVSLAMLTSSVTFAHPGRTDARGGHKDNKNVSSLGFYHYHCGDNPAHLHTNGSCPYASKPKAVPTSSSSSTVSKSKATSSASAKIYAKVPNFPVKISGVDVNNAKAEYPPLHLNDITYIPLTYDVLTHLDLDYTWDNSTNLTFNRKSNSSEKKQFNQMFLKGSSSYGNSAQISKVNKGIIVNSSTVSNKYPIISHKGINYLPLTWEITQSLGLEGGWTSGAGFDLKLK